MVCSSTTASFFEFFSFFFLVLDPIFWFWIQWLLIVFGGIPLACGEKKTRVLVDSFSDNENFTTFEFLDAAYSGVISWCYSLNWFEPPHSRLISRKSGVSPPFILKDPSPCYSLF